MSAGSVSGRAKAQLWNGSAWVDAPGDATNGLDVDVTRLPAGTVAGSSSLPAGTNNIGDVDVLTLPAITGSVTADTELPAAANITDADADPISAPSVASRLSGFDATNWRRVRVDTNGRLQVVGTGAPGDAAALGSATQIPMSMYNGANWDRVRGTIANGLLVDVSRVQGSVTVTEQATAANLGALSSLLKVIGTYDFDQAQVRPLPVANAHGSVKVLVSDLPVRNQLKKMTLVLEEIRDLLRNQRS